MIKLGGAQFFLSWRGEREWQLWRGVRKGGGVREVGSLEGGREGWPVCVYAEREGERVWGERERERGEARCHCV